MDEARTFGNYTSKNFQKCPVWRNPNSWIPPKSSMKLGWKREKSENQEMNNGGGVSKRNDEMVVGYH